MSRGPLKCIPEQRLAETRKILIAGQPANENRRNCRVMRQFSGELCWKVAQHNAGGGKRVKSRDSGSEIDGCHHVNDRHAAVLILPGAKFEPVVKSDDTAAKALPIMLLCERFDAERA